MCAIVDANVAHEVFGSDRPPAGERFFDWLSGPRGQLVVGGRLRDELARDQKFVQWLRTALRNGHARSVADEAVEGHAEQLRREGVCKSNDLHVVALALVSGARLLYTNDAALIADFGRREIVASPRGKVYTTARYADGTDAHRRLLAARDLCRVPRG